MSKERVYVCIDLKTFYASVECCERGLDPFTTNLVVADPERSKTTICLAITPAMKALGIRNRCRVFEIPEHVNYIMAKPRMRRYMEVSADIYTLYLKYVSPDDIHVYSIDECFIDATPYLDLYDRTAKQFAIMLMEAVFLATGICATAGIGTNLFLAKVALDITAKHMADNIGYLDKDEFIRLILPHRPITDIWNIGPGIAKRLVKYGVRDLAGVVAMDPSTLYREFGINAEFLIDHAHGVEPCTMKQIKEYNPKDSSLGNGQVLHCDYAFDDARVVLREMVDMSVLELVEKHLVVDHISLRVGYAKEKYSSGSGQDTAEATPSLAFSEHDAIADPVGAREEFIGEHGRRSSSGGREGMYTGGTRKLSKKTNSFKELMSCFDKLFCETTDKEHAIRRLNVGFSGLVGEEFATLDLFTNVAADTRERHVQEAVLAVKGKFGKNALVKGISLTKKATARERNEQVGGHHG